MVPGREGRPRDRPLRRHEAVRDDRAGPARKGLTLHVTELAPGLWRWIAVEEAGSVYCEAFGDVLVIDPLLPPDDGDRDRFWRALDRDVARAGSSLHVLLTCAWHARDSGEIAERYPGAAVVLPTPGAPLPGQVTAIEAALEGEVLLWLPSHRALVAGDTLVGDGAGGVRLGPHPRLGGGDATEIRAALWERVAGLPVEHVLVSHGEPVSGAGRDALARALG